MSNTVWSHVNYYIYPTVTASKFKNVCKKMKVHHGLYQVAYRKEVVLSEVLHFDGSEECAQFQSLLG
jgi:hypothetical protein